jgi:hypothetical protein
LEKIFQNFQKFFLSGYFSKILSKFSKIFKIFQNVKIFLTKKDVPPKFRGGLSAKSIIKDIQIQTHSRKNYLLRWILIYVRNDSRKITTFLRD